MDNKINKMVWVFALLLVPIMIGSFIFVSGPIGFYAEDGNTQDLMPAVSINAIPSQGQSVLFVANAEDDREIKSISIYVDGSEVERCTFSLLPSASCEYVGSGFASGTHSFKAVATDGTHTVATSDKIFAI